MYEVGYELFLLIGVLWGGSVLHLSHTALNAGIRRGSEGCLDHLVSSGIITIDDNGIIKAKC